MNNKKQKQLRHLLESAIKEATEAERESVLEEIAKRLPDYSAWLRKELSQQKYDNN